jgi:hypothetical protein
MTPFACFLTGILVASSLLHDAQAEPCGARAQEPIATDRPQIASSSIVVPCGSLQFENGLSATSAAGQRTFDLPETSARLGVFSKTELRFGVPIYFQNDPTTSGFVNGFGDFSLGFKQQLGPVKGGFDVSVIPAVSLPVGAKAISSHGYDPSVQIPWSRAMTKTWTAAGMFSVSSPTQGPRRNVTGQASVYFDRQLTQPWDAYIEYSGSFPQRGGPIHQVDCGMAYKIAPRQQLDLHGGFGFSAASPDYSIGIGYSLRFQAFRFH